MDRKESYFLSLKEKPRKQVTKIQLFMLPGTNKVFFQAKFILEQVHEFYD